MHNGNVRPCRADLFDPGSRFGGVFSNYHGNSNKRLSLKSQTGALWVRARDSVLCTMRSSFTGLRLASISIPYVARTKASQVGRYCYILMLMTKRLPNSVNSPEAGILTRVPSSKRRRRSTRIRQDPANPQTPFECVCRMRNPRIKTTETRN